MKESSIILHNIRSSHNVGSIFRTADAAGITRIYLCGYTPRPLDQFGRVNNEIAKTALGAEKTIPWEYAKSPNGFISKLKKKGTMLIGIEQSSKSIDYKEAKIKYPVAFLVGNEVKGISKALQAKCDLIAEIPMRGKKESLNVAVSLGIALFRMLNI